MKYLFYAYFKLIVMCQKKTMEELDKILTDRESTKAIEFKEFKRRELSIQLGFCPECGCPIIDELVEVFEEPKTSFFGLFTKYEKKWDNRKVCSKDKSHYEKKSMDISYNDYGCG